MTMPRSPSHARASAEVPEGTRPASLVRNPHINFRFRDGSVQLELRERGLSLSLPRCVWDAFDGSVTTDVLRTLSAQHGIEVEEDLLEALVAEKVLIEGDKHQPPEAAVCRLAATLSESFKAGLARRDLRASRSAIEQIVRLLPDSHEALTDRAGVLLEEGLYAEAQVSIKRALELRSDYLPALKNWFQMALALGDEGAALKIADLILEKHPACMAGIVAKATALHYLGRCEEALDTAGNCPGTGAIEVKRRTVKGNILMSLGRDEEALVEHCAVLSMDPASAEAHNNIGTVYYNQHQTARALDYIHKALELRPSYTEARYNKALCDLRAGNFEEGWQGFEHRLAGSRMRKLWGQYAGPRWTGARSDGAVLLLEEQGFGDVIQFSRFVAPVQRIASQVLLCVRPTLQRLLGRSFPGVACVSAERAAAFRGPHASLLSLPAILKLGAPAAAAPLRADPERVRYYAARHDKDRRLRVGLALAGSARHRNDLNRSIPAEKVAEHLTRDIFWHSIQPQVSAETKAIWNRQGVTALLEESADFDETAALLMTLDLIVSVDTSVAHLAGALGKETWVMLPFKGCDWRWQTSGEATPWYPTMRLFRQGETEEWEDVLVRVWDELSRRSAATRSEAGAPGPKEQQPALRRFL